MSLHGCPSSSQHCCTPVLDYIPQFWWLFFFFTVHLPWVKSLDLHKNEHTKKQRLFQNTSLIVSCHAACFSLTFILNSAKSPVCSPFSPVPTPLQAHHPFNARISLCSVKISSNLPFTSTEQKVPQCKNVRWGCIKKGKVRKRLNNLKTEAAREMRDMRGDTESRDCLFAN